MFSISLDWLSFTWKRSFESVALLQTLSNSDAGAAITPRFGYNWGRQCKNGLVIMGHSERDDMGIHVSMSGSTLRSLEDTGLSCRDILRQVIRSGAKVSRLDLAKDAQNEPIDLSAISSAVLDGKRSGRAQSCSMVRSDTGGQTLYIGSRSSERFARIYDKAAQTRVVGRWLRYEFEMKGDVARQMSGALAQDGVDWNGVFGAMAQDFLNVDAGNYALWLEGASVEGLPKIEKQTDREKWIMEQVIPAITDHLAKNPDSAAIQALFYALRPYFENEG